MRGENTLDHVYLLFRDEYKALPCPPFSKSDHVSVLLLPSYRRKLKCDRLVKQTIHRLLDKSDLALCHCFSTTKWCGFQNNNTDRSHWQHRRMYWRRHTKDYITDILKSEGLTEKSVPNLKHGPTPTTTTDLEEYRKSRYTFRRAISSAKRQYREKVESTYQGSNIRNMWAWLKTITDYKRKTSSAEVMSASLPDELNIFCACFERNSPPEELQKAQEGQGRCVRIA